MECIVPAGSHDLCRTLRLVPTNVQRSHDVKEQIGRDATRIIPILPETEEAIRVIGPLRRRAKEHGPIDVILALSVRTGLGFYWVIPLAFDGVAVVRPLAHDHLADHAV